MENHISAAVLDGVNSFKAYLTPANATILLSIGSDSIFRASVETSGTQSGWTVTDISPLLVPQYPTGTTLTAHHLDASANIVSGGFGILLSVTAVSGKNTFDEVWILSGPSGKDASTWLQGGDNITFRKLAYDPTPSPPIESITATTLSTSGLYLEHGPGAADPTLAIATVADPGSPGEIRFFTLNLSSGASPVWAYLPQEQNIGNNTLTAVPGRIKASSFWGLYKLYSLNGVTSLTFLPSQGTFGNPVPTIYTPPPGATTIASLTYQPTSPALTYSDLFVAADGYIAYFPYTAGKSTAFVQLITSPLVKGVTELHAVNCDGTVVVWGLNAAGQVFYTSAPLASVATSSSWLPPITLLSGTSRIAALAGTAADNISLFALAPLTTTSATGSSAISDKGNTSNGLIQLNRNPSTRAWLNLVHPLPSTADCITLKTYTTRILVVDSNNVPQINTPVSASLSSDCSLIINGATTLVSSSDVLNLVTDASGYVNLIHAVSSLSTPVVTLTLPDKSTLTIDAHGEVLKKLSAITQPSQLTGATYVDGNGKTQNVVPLNTDPNAVQGVVDGLQVITPQIPKLPLKPPKDDNLKAQVSCPSQYVRIAYLLPRDSQEVYAHFPWAPSLMQRRRRTISCPTSETSSNGLSTGSKASLTRLSRRLMTRFSSSSPSPAKSSKLLFGVWKTHSMPSPRSSNGSAQRLRHSSAGLPSCSTGEISSRSRTRSRALFNRLPSRWALSRAI